ncbi:uncharacterized protein LOC131286122 [Anopheles ziemanni]|uniref:uncharacterized protein LOC131260621 n=1 Tax=Anopheles coustani TaxID=139045 RepID=UPI0026590755|nr:uncharacterized protein LOC131260621 [Anopheles coustani]XP_058118375.1 uncharacterized protein LOC131260621 [Anopheles coustani]XP_058170992.1 uncharacterized protein LOC131286122 [Anopheles ziemanni]XP_058170993.1 uncharacterized protein LOC131286122 [Anopheles ziemanni]
MAIRSLRYVASVSASFPKPVTSVGQHLQQLQSPLNNNIGRCLSAQLSVGSSWPQPPVRQFSAFQGSYGQNHIGPNGPERNICASKAPSMVNVRSLSMQEVSRSIQMITDKPRNVVKDQQTLQLKQQCEKPVVLIISWLNARQKHLAKYAELYIDQGFDVFVAQITPWQLLWPVKGTQLVAAEIVKFLKNNEFKNGLVLHGFSVAGYLWGECLVHIARDLANYQVVLDRVTGQVWDSAADITEISVGVPTALFPKNPTLQNALRKYMLYHMKAFHEPATSHYIRSSQMFHTNLLRCPALFLVSKTDPVGTVEANTRVKDSWEQSGVKTTFHCWDRSPHVGHFMKHREEYIDVLFHHLRQLNLPTIKQDALLRAKL